VATVLVSRGVGPKKAAWWALFTALPQPLLAVPSFMFVDTFTFLLPLALGFAAGCMTWMVFAELIPDSLADAPHGKVSSVLITFFRLIPDSLADAPHGKVSSVLIALFV